jgi:hypothetical protein
MGYSRFSRDDYAARSSVRASTAAKTGKTLTSVVFDYDDKVKSGKAHGVHASLSPKGLKVRECRDSDAHPTTIPIIVGLDTTGSMAKVPLIIQSKLPHLMGSFMDDKASGKRYLGDGYPAIMVAAIDDYAAMGGSGDGCLQVGQFESGMEIDDNLTNLWLTGQGGGTYEENYDLLVYVAAHHTAHDHWEKRRRKGYLFLIGDEHAYDVIRASVVRDVMGCAIQDDMRFKDVLKKAQERYHVFFVLPNMTQHFGDINLRKYWQALLGQQNMLPLEAPEKICELIVGAVALCEEFVGIDDLEADSLGSTALVPLAKSGSGLSRVDAGGLPAVPGTPGGVERL